MNVRPARSDGAMGVAPGELRERLEEMVDAGVLDLPLLPAVAAEVIQLTSSDECDPRRLADVIRGDPALAGHLLHMANSVTLRGRTPVVSLHQAMTRLGLAQVRELAFVISCQNRVFKVRGREEQIKMLFSHSLATAMFAQEIARTKRANVEEAFLAGLLHDVGKPVLLQAAMDIAPRSHDIDEQELDDALNALHAYVGSELARRWGLSDRLAEAIAHHHHPAGSPMNVQGALIVRFADDVAYRLERQTVCGPSIFAEFRAARGAPTTNAGAFRGGATKRCDGNRRKDDGSKPFVALEGDDAKELHMHPAVAALNLYPEDVEAVLGIREAVIARLEAMR